jgi:hypothetical protein
MFYVFSQSRYQCRDISKVLLLPRRKFDVSWKHFSLSQRSLLGSLYCKSLPPDGRLHRNWGGQRRFVVLNMMGVNAAVGMPV